MYQPPESRVVIASTRAGKFSGKNTIDLQWKMRANYNARPCAGEGKAAGAGTMASDEKTMRRKIEIVGNNG